MGAVYLAQDLELDRPVALKVARVSASGSVKLLKRMEIEARSAAKVDHPLICKVYDAGEIDGIRFIALQYIEGEDLKKLMKRTGRRREPEEAVSLILQILHGLEAAHEMGVIHRDLKPENVMLNKKREPVIMDFGLARRTIASSDAGLTQGMIVGTAAYMSPEQATGKAEAIDHRSDLYAVGVMLFEMLTGEWPFTGGAIEVMGKKCVQDPPSPLTLNPTLNPQLAAICHQMISRQKGDRYVTCAEAIEALESIALVTSAVKNQQVKSISSPSVMSSPSEPAGSYTSQRGSPVVEKKASESDARSFSISPLPTRLWNQPIARWLILGSAGIALAMMVAGLFSGRLDAPVNSNIVAKPGDQDLARRNLSEISGNPAEDNPKTVYSLNNAELSPALKSINLIDLFNPAEGVLSGKWTKQDKTITCQDVWGCKLIEFSYVPPEEYDYAIKFTVVSQFDAFQQVCYANERQFMWTLSGRINSTSGFGEINGKDYESTPTRVDSRGWISDGNSYTSVVKVRKDGVEAYLDDKLVSQWKTDFSDMSLPGYIRPRQNQTVGLAFWGSHMIIESAEIIPFLDDHEPSDQSPKTDLDRIATGKWIRLVDSKTVLPDPNRMSFHEGILSLNNTIYRFPEVNARNVILRAQVRKISGQHVNLKVRVNAAEGSFYAAWYNGQLDGGDLFGIHKWQNREWLDLGQGHIGREIAQDQFVEMAFASVDDDLVLFVDGSQVYSFKNDDLKSGFVEVGTLRGVGEFKNVEYQILDSDDKNTPKR